MTDRYLPVLCRVIALMLFILITHPADAQLYASSPYRISRADSLASIVIGKNAGNIVEDGRPAENTALKWSNAAEKKRLLGYLKTLNLTQERQDFQPNKKFYYRLANVFARLRLYPLAMKCFLKSVPKENGELIIAQDDAETMTLDTAALLINSKDDAGIAEQAALPRDKKSETTSYSKIQNDFNDGKVAAGYALLFHVKQPVPGKRKIFVGGNTGHTFITLIKYNKDSTYVSASFGFYPKKDQLLSATPLMPATSSTFKDDAGHQWDEVVGKFISKSKFEKILKLTEDFNGVKYNLNNRNCTDFGLRAADLAGITITDTAGKWPLGQGNNPAVTGQSLLMGKVSDKDFGKDVNLFKANLVGQ